MGRIRQQKIIKVFSPAAHTDLLDGIVVSVGHGVVLLLDRHQVPQHSLGPQQSQSRIDSKIDNQISYSWTDIKCPNIVLVRSSLNLGQIMRQIIRYLIAGQTSSGPSIVLVRSSLNLGQIARQIIRYFIAGQTSSGPTQSWYAVVSTYDGQQDRKLDIL